MTGAEEQRGAAGREQTGWMPAGFEERTESAEEPVEIVRRATSLPDQAWVVQQKCREIVKEGRRPASVLLQAQQSIERVLPLKEQVQVRVGRVASVERPVASARASEEEPALATEENRGRSWRGERRHRSVSEVREAREAREAAD